MKAKTLILLLLFSFNFSYASNNNYAKDQRLFLSIHTKGLKSYYEGKNKESRKLTLKHRNDKISSNFKKGYKIKNWKAKLEKIKVDDQGMIIYLSNHGITYISPAAKNNNAELDKLKPPQIVEFSATFQGELNLNQDQKHEIESPFYMIILSNFAVAKVEPTHKEKKEDHLIELKKLDEHVQKIEEANFGKELNVNYNLSSIWIGKGMIINASMFSSEILEKITNKYPKQYSKVRINVWISESDMDSQEDEIPLRGLTLTYDMNELSQVKWDDIVYASLLNYAEPSNFYGAGRKSVVEYCSDKMRYNLAKKFCFATLSKL